jgi:uncharacterized membrane protein YfcA
MDYLIVAFTVLIGAGLTFFSGFGLGTLMLPVFSIFFPLPVAIGATAIVHLSNNIFKFGLVYKNINLPVLFRFGFPAVIFATVGAYCLGLIGKVESLHSYSIGDKIIEITLLKVVIGSLMIFFAWFDLDPRFSNLKIKKQWIPFGGVLSGFFGGISGHQGAFRSAFLNKSGLTKEEFIGTSNAIALLIDLARLIVYYETFNFVVLNNNKSLLLVGIVFAFIGTYFGKQLVKKTTMKGIQKVVGVMLFVLGGLFIAGLV